MLWHSLTEQGVGNGDPEALSVVYEQVAHEVGEPRKRGAKNNRLRLIITCSDGGYGDEASLEMQMLAKKFHDLNAHALVVGIGLTESAAQVPVVMENPPYSRGEIVRNINDLPVVIAKYVILEAVKLFPEKARASVGQTIENAIAKFANLP